MTNTSDATHRPHPQGLKRTEAGYPASPKTNHVGNRKEPQGAGFLQRLSQKIGISTERWIALFHASESSVGLWEGVGGGSVLDAIEDVWILCLVEMKRCWLFCVLSINLCLSRNFSLSMYSRKNTTDNAQPIKYNKTQRRWQTAENIR